MDDRLAVPGVLAQPTRARLFELLQELKRQASTEELAQQLGLHVNGVRRQLEQLRQAGLVERTKTRHGRGRPRDGWSVAVDAKPGGERPRAYSDLGRWLSAAIPPGRARLREVEQKGREIGRELAPGGAGQSAQAFEQVLAALGFGPDLEVDSTGSARCRLCNCPYRDAARENPEVVCTLHRGITAGLLDELAPEARLVTFEPHDPDLAGCLVEIAATRWSESPAGSDRG